MASTGVTLGTKKAKGILYRELRWHDPKSGKHRAATIGRAAELSLRKAEKLRRLKEADLTSSPHRRSMGRVPTLNDYVNDYI